MQTPLDLTLWKFCKTPLNLALYNTHKPGDKKKYSDKKKNTHQQTKLLILRKPHYLYNNRVHFYSFSVFERKKRLRSFKNPSVQCDFQSEILKKHKTLITLDWGFYLTSKGHFRRLHFFEFFNKNWDFLINFARKS